MKIKERKIVLRVGVFSSSREISARLVEVERQPEGAEQDEEGAYAGERRRCNGKANFSEKKGDVDSKMKGEPSSVHL